MKRLITSKLSDRQVEILKHLARVEIAGFVSLSSHNNRYGTRDSLIGRGLVSCDDGTITVNGWKMIESLDGLDQKF